jgi:predicted transcriptional regulator
MDEIKRDRPAPSRRILDLNINDGGLSELEIVTKALGSDKRLAILKLLGEQTCSVLDIAEALHIPQSTATQHINILEKAGLITTDLMPARRGLQKICARTYDRINIQLPSVSELVDTTSTISMPVGAYVNASVHPTCGLAGESTIIAEVDNPLSFYEPDHIYAQLLWFRAGFVEYRFPNHLPSKASLESLELSFEVCSEAPLNHADWPSDITVWINDMEIGTWTSPADYGGERGILTPDWWGSINSQYGLLKVWKVTAKGSYIDGNQTSGVCLEDLIQSPGTTFDVRIGIKDDAHNQGGVNLFGRKFGNYPQDIVMKQNFRWETSQ